VLFGIGFLKAVKKAILAGNIVPLFFDERPFLLFVRRKRDLTFFIQIDQHGDMSIRFLNRYLLNTPLKCIIFGFRV
jgi:hypothetical protein